MSDKMTAEQKKWIDEASYESLLHRWRFAAVGSPWFTGETGDYYSTTLAQKREKEGPDAAVRASKSVGWEHP